MQEIKWNAKFWTTIQQLQANDKEENNYCNEHKYEITKLKQIQFNSIYVFLKWISEYHRKVHRESA